MVRRLIASKIVRWQKRSAPMYTASERSGESAPSHDGIRARPLLIIRTASTTDRRVLKGQGGPGGPVQPSANLPANPVRTRSRSGKGKWESQRNFHFPYVQAAMEKNSRLWSILPRRCVRVCSPLQRRPRCVVIEPQGDQPRTELVIVTFHSCEHDSSAVNKEPSKIGIAVFADAQKPCFPAG